MNIKTKERFGEERKPINKAYPVLFVLALLGAVGYGAAVSTVHSWDLGLTTPIPK